MAAKSQKTVLIFLACLVALGLVSLFAASLARSNQNFRKELAKRLETEEALLKLENERSALLTELKGLQGQLVQSAQRLNALTGQLEQELKSRQELQSAFEKAREAQVSAQPSLSEPLNSSKQAP